MQVVQKIIAGDIFGEIGVLCDRPQPFTARTTELSQILRLSRSSLTSIIQANKADEHIIMSNLYLKLKSLENNQGSFEHQKSEEYCYGEWFNNQQESKMCIKNGCEDQIHESSLIYHGSFKVNEEQTPGFSSIIQTRYGNEGSHKLCHYCNQVIVAKNSRSSNYIEHSESGISNTNNMLRVMIYMNSQSDRVEEQQYGKLIILPDSIEKLFSIAGKKFGRCFNKIINTENAEIEDISVIRDGDHLFFLQ